MVILLIFVYCFWVFCKFWFKFFDFCWLVVWEVVFEEEFRVGNVVDLYVIDKYVKVMFM